MIVNLNEALRIPQSVFVTRGEVLQKYPDTTKRFLKAVILGMQFARYNKQEAIKIGFAAGLKGEPEVVNRPTISSAPATPSICPSPTTVFKSCSTKTSTAAWWTKSLPWTG